LDEFPAAALWKPRRRITIHRRTGKIKPDDREKRRKMSSKKDASNDYSPKKHPRIRQSLPSGTIPGLFACHAAKKRKNIRQNGISGLNPRRFRVTLLFRQAERFRFFRRSPQPSTSN
jgi:hypothetical protein